MAEVALLYGAGSRAGLIELDAIVSEGHELPSEATEHPVEEGVDITDHVRRKLVTLEIQGVVTSTPIVKTPDPATTAAREAVAKAVKAFEAELRGNAILNAIPIVGGVVAGGLNTKIREKAQSGRMMIEADGENPNQGRPSAVWAELKRLWTEAQRVTVATTLGDYPSMVITNVRTGGGVDSIEVSISLRELRVVSTEATEIPPELLKPKDMGNQATKPAPAQAGAAAAAAVDNRTGAHRFWDAIVGGGR